MASQCWGTSCLEVLEVPEHQAICQTPTLGHLASCHTYSGGESCRLMDFGLMKFDMPSDNGDGRPFLQTYSTQGYLIWMCIIKARWNVWRLLLKGEDFQDLDHLLVALRFPEQKVLFPVSTSSQQISAISLHLMLAAGWVFSPSPISSSCFSV